MVPLYNHYPLNCFPCQLNSFTIDDLTYDKIIMPLYDITMIIHILEILANTCTYYIKNKYGRVTELCDVHLRIMITHYMNCFIKWTYHISNRGTGNMIYYIIIYFVIKYSKLNSFWVERRYRGEHLAFVLKRCAYILFFFRKNTYSAQ